MDFNIADSNLQRTARDVFDRIPREDQRHIESTCDQIVSVGDGDCEAEFVRERGEIRLFVPRINEFSEDGRLGIIAHEFGHAYACAAGHDRPGGDAETLANMIAQRWGFVRQIEQMKADTERFRKGD